MGPKILLIKAKLARFYATCTPTFCPQIEYRLKSTKYTEYRAQNARDTEKQRTAVIWATLARNTRENAEFAQNTQEFSRFEPQINERTAQGAIWDQN